MKRVLVIEDDLLIQELLNIHLIDLDCEVTKATNGSEGYALFLKETWDLLILDLMLPGMGGLEICKAIRERNKTVPILMLTAKSEEIDKVLGLEIGADDYITKPFSIREFIARVKALFRRSNRATENVIETAGKELIFNNGHLTIDLENHKVLINGKREELTPKEFDLIALLAAKPGKSYTRQTLLSLIWGYEFSGYEHTVNSHINRLRAKIEPDVNNPTYILTTWGVGYRFSDSFN